MKKILITILISLMLITNVNAASKINNSTVPKITVKSLNYNTNQITITKVNNASYYNIYYSTNNKSFSLLTKCTKLSYKHTNLNTGTVYYYKIMAFDKNGNHTKYSSVSNAKPTLNTPAYTLSTSASGMSTIKITKVAGATGYMIYRSTKQKDGYTLIKTTTDLSYLDRVPLNILYYYKIKAYYEDTTNSKKYYSGISAVKSITNKLSAPVLSTSRYSSQRISYSVKDSSDYVNYEIYYSANNKSGYKLISTTSKGITPTLEVNKKYYLKARSYIVADNKKYYSSYSSQVEINASPILTSFNVKFADKKVTISITSSKYNTGYVIYRSTSSTGNYTEIAKVKETGSTISYIDTSAKLNNTYYYKVKPYIYSTKYYAGTLSNYKLISTKILCTENCDPITKSSKTKATVYNSSTLKYWYEVKDYYNITHIWVKDATKQVNTWLYNGTGGSAKSVYDLAVNLKEKKNLYKKGIVISNASFFSSSEFSQYLYDGTAKQNKSISSWKNYGQNPLIISGSKI